MFDEGGCQEIQPSIAVSEGGDSRLSAAISRAQPVTEANLLLNLAAESPSSERILRRSCRPVSSLNLRPLPPAVIHRWLEIRRSSTRGMDSGSTLSAAFACI